MKGTKDFAKMTMEEFSLKMSGMFGEKKFNDGFEVLKDNFSLP